MSKIILHIDLNAFFVRCEEIKNPSLEGKPVIIGRTGRGGIVSTCSYAARKFGVHSGQPTYEALIKCPDALILEGDYHYYSEKSHEFFNFIKKFTNLIEPASIDECFADFTEVLKVERTDCFHSKHAKGSLQRNKTYVFNRCSAYKIPRQNGFRYEKA